MAGLPRPFCFYALHFILKESIFDNTTFLKISQNVTLTACLNWMWQHFLTKQRCEYEEEAGSQVNINGLDVGDLRQGRVGRRDQGGHRQDGRHAQVDSRH